MNKNKIATFGEQIRTLRVDAQLTLREVAEKIGLDNSLLGKIERSERKPTKEQIKLVAKYFNLNEKDLLNEFLSDQIAYRILEEQADLNILKVAERKVEYLKTKQ